MDASAPQPVTIKQLLQERQGVWRGYFSNYEQCMEFEQSLLDQPIVDVDQKANEVDDFPYTLEAEQQCAYQIWQAMMDFSEYIESADQKETFQVDRLKAVSEVEIELLAWKVLRQTENAHRGAPGFRVNPEGSGKKQIWPWRHASFGSFGARLNSVLNACRQSKSIVYNLLTDPSIRKLSSDAKHELESKIANKKLNNKRAAAKKARGNDANPGQARLEPSQQAPDRDQLSQQAPDQASLQLSQQGPDQASLELHQQAPSQDSLASPRPATKKTQAGGVTKGRKKTQKLSRHAVVVLDNSLRSQSIPGSQARATHATSGGIQMAQEGLLTTGLGAEAPAVACVSGPSNMPAWGANGGAVGLLAVLQRPLEDSERDQEYEQQVKALLRGQQLGRGDN